MYRIYDTTSAIREVQIYLGLAGNPDIVVVPSGVYDDNTRLSGVDFQRSEGLREDGVVDRETFERLYGIYVILRDANELNKRVDSFISFPLSHGQSSSGMIHINGMLGRLMTHYGFTNNLRENSFYSHETERAVKELRKIYLLDDKEDIDEIFYMRMIKDHDSIDLFNENFN